MQTFIKFERIVPVIMPVKIFYLSKGTCIFTFHGNEEYVRFRFSDM